MPSTLRLRRGLLSSRDILTSVENGTLHRTFQMVYD